MKYEYILIKLFVFDSFPLYLNTGTSLSPSRSITAPLESFTQIWHFFCPVNIPFKCLELYYSTN
ncbi:hypothetical protein H5410_057770 [Solanum commersonii]|uniref:Uncharacterized protein n=1 Tax=Solanum commersonii TaxID=4109 RepID=A0A9J5WR56_SOLCO|nr:hypothetical protein H5410_057770 [Solanum commersonii]